MTTVPALTTMLVLALPGSDDALIQHYTFSDADPHLAAEPAARARQVPTLAHSRRDL
ncbi:MAG: hypothetical protein ACRETW_03485 [Stenotrophobium sp.]